MARRTANAPTVPWDSSSGRRLANARAALAHDESGCIERLVELGGRRISQSTLCKWESGSVLRLDEETAQAISRYCEESGLDIATQIERALTNEPMLSDRQARLVDGFANRLIQGPMTDAEVRFAQTLLRSVGL
jgi:hypothetical protein